MFTHVNNGNWETGNIQHTEEWIKLEKDNKGKIISPIGLVKFLEKEDINIFNNEIYLKLDALDKKKSRALTDFVLTGDKSRLQDLEIEAGELRSQLKVLPDEEANNA